MGQDAWNLMFGTRHNAKYRKGTSTDMHVDEGYAGQMVPGYAGPYKNWKGKVSKKKAVTNAHHSATDNMARPPKTPKKRK